MFAPDAIMNTRNHHAAAPRSDADAIAAAARMWLKPRSPWMALAKRKLTAFSPRMIELGLRELFEDIAAHVGELKRREAPRITNHQSRTTVCHVLSGNLPNPGIVSIIVGLLAGARNVVKPAAGDPMPALFVESLARVEAALARRVELTADREAYRRAKIVVAYGDDETLRTLQRNRRRDAGARFLGFGHRASIGLVNFSSSTLHARRSTILAAARDASMWDQQGCMSPQCFYVRGDAAAFAEALALEMERFDRRRPRATLPFGDAAAIARARSEWSFRGRVWASRGTTHWTVVLDEVGGWAPSPLNRFIFVRPIQSGTGILPVSSSMDRRDACPPLSTVGFAGFSPKEIVAMARADRYCSLGEMQRPSLLLTHGSRPRVGDLMHES
jgi:Acyl-CoA reductase (LuxC)